MPNRTYVHKAAVLLSKQKYTTTSISLKRRQPCPELVDSARWVSHGGDLRERHQLVPKSTRQTDATR